jgi:DNA repair exonuclease SbcCD nuclease subunit
MAKQKKGKWGLCADWQFSLGSRQSVDAEMISPRLNDALKCFDWVVNRCVEEGCVGLHILGDVFDSRTSLDLPVIDRVCRAVKAAATRIPITILPGNHDSYSRHVGITSVQMFLGHCTVVDKPTVIGQWGFVPWCEDTAELECGVRHVAQQGADYLCGHALVDGAVPKASGISPAILHPELFDRVFVGDVHEPVEVEIPNYGGGDNLVVQYPPIQYIGSPMQIDFRDVGGVRGFYLFDSDKNELEYVENDVSPRFWIVSSVDDFDGIEKGDYVRIKTGSAEASKALVDAMAGHHLQPASIESDYVLIEDTKLRLEVRTSDGELPALQKYVDYALKDENPKVRKRRLELMSEILEEVKS